MANKTNKIKVSVLHNGCIVKNIYAIRKSNQTLYLKNIQFPNSDNILLEDKNGYRYSRCLPINPETDFSYFTIM